MTVQPEDQMRPVILDTKSYFLAEQAGMFCDGLTQSLELHPLDFSEARFVSERDEPYEVHFEWWFGDVTAGVTLRADADESEWFVNRVSGTRRSRFRKAVGDDPHAAALPFLQCLCDELRKS